MYLNIGPICYCLNVEAGMQFGQPDTPYCGFWSELPSKDAVLRIPVEVVLHKPVLPADYGLLFDTNDAWQAYKKNNARIITHWPERDEPPVWAAFFDIEMQESGVRIECDPVWFETAQGWRNPLSYPLDHVLSMYVLSGSGMILHGCGVVLDGAVTVFAGVSGSGKSTMARRVLSELPVTVLSDDRVVIAGEGRRFRAYGSPWLGEADLAENQSAVLKSICLLNKGAGLSKVRIDAGSAVKRLLPVMAVPWYERELTENILQTTDELVSSIEIYEVTVPLEGPVASFLQ